jgi:hypothetical protein
MMLHRKNSEFYRGSGLESETWNRVARISPEVPAFSHYFTE